MRASRTNLTLIALVALAALLCGPAAGRGQGPFDDIDWGKKSITVKRLGEESKNFLVRVSDGKKTVIVKFTQDVPMTINFADRMLEQMGIPVPKSLALPLTDPSAKKALQARKAIRAKLEQDGKAINSIDLATTIIAFEEVTMFGSYGTVQKILSGFDTEQKGDAPPPLSSEAAELLQIKKLFPSKKLNETQRKRLQQDLRSVRALVICVAKPKQANVLGQLTVYDAFLGNADRTLRGGRVAWRNVMVGTIAATRTSGKESEPNFVAIDNFAFAPSLEEVAWLDNYKRVKENWRKNPPANETTVPEKVTAPDRKEWVSRLIHGVMRKKQNGNKTVILHKGLQNEGGLWTVELEWALNVAETNPVATAATPMAPPNNATVPTPTAPTGPRSRRSSLPTPTAPTPIAPTGPRSRRSSLPTPAAPPNTTGTGLDRDFPEKTVSEVIVGDLRDQLHLLLFVHMKEFVVAVTPTGTSLPTNKFTNFASANLAVAVKTPKKEDSTWTFAVATEISKNNEVSYQAFKIDWAKVKENIEEGMKTAVNQLVSQLPASSTESNGGGRGQQRGRAAAVRMTVNLDLKGYKSSKFVVEFRDKVATLAPVGSATVDAEALYVRLAYLALRKEMRQKDAAAIASVLTTLGPPPPATYTLQYVWPKYNSESLLRRKR